MGCAVSASAPSSQPMSSSLRNAGNTPPSDHASPATLIRTDGFGVADCAVLGSPNVHVFRDNGTFYCDGSSSGRRVDAMAVPTASGYDSCTSECHTKSRPRESDDAPISVDQEPLLQSPLHRDAPPPPHPAPMMQRECGGSVHSEGGGADRSAAFATAASAKRLPQLRRVPTTTIVVPTDCAAFISSPQLNASTVPGNGALRALSLSAGSSGIYVESPPAAPLQQSLMSNVASSTDGWVVASDQASAAGLLSPQVLRCESNRFTSLAVFESTNMSSGHPLQEASAGTFDATPHSQKMQQHHLGSLSGLEGQQQLQLPQFASAHCTQSQSSFSPQQWSARSAPRIPHLDVASRSSLAAQVIPQDFVVPPVAALTMQQHQPLSTVSSVSRHPFQPLQLMPSNGDVQSHQADGTLLSPLVSAYQGTPTSQGISAGAGGDFMQSRALPSWGDDRCIF